MVLDTHFGAGTPSRWPETAPVVVTGEIPAFGTEAATASLTVSAYFDGEPDPTTYEMIYSWSLRPVCQKPTGELFFGSAQAYSSLLINWATYMGYPDRTSTSVTVACPSTTTFHHVTLCGYANNVNDCPLSGEPPTSLSEDELQMYAALLAPAFAASGLAACEPLTFAPQPLPRSSLPAGLAACEAAVSAGLPVKDILVAVLMSAAGAVGVYTLLRELPLTTPAPPPAPDPTPTPTPTPTLPPPPPPAPTLDEVAGQVAAAWEPRTMGPASLNGQPQTRPSPETVRTAARECVQALVNAGAALTAAGDECSTKPVLFPGGAPGLGQEAAAHVRDVLVGTPLWVRLDYVSGEQKLASGVTRQWYKNYPQCKPSTPGTECDEFPMYASVQGGPAAAAQNPLALRRILTADNKAVGTAHGVMVTACGLTSATAAGPAPGGKSEFLVVPLASVAVPSFFVCGLGEQ